MTAAGPPLRYVVLRHEGIPDPHYDLMLETSPAGNLVTWRCAVWPLVDRTPLVPLGEHRRAYLDYEGPVSRNRGDVRRVASGTFHWLQRGGVLSLIRFLEPEPMEWLIGSAPDGSAVAMRA